MKERFEQIWDKEWFSVSKRNGFRLACCDCGLVHDVFIRVSARGKIEMRMDMNGQATSGHRRAASLKRKAST